MVLRYFSNPLSEIFIVSESIRNYVAYQWPDKIYLQKINILILSPMLIENIWRA